MHVAPAEFRSVRNDGLTLRFAILGPVSYVLAELPPGGSAGTLLEDPCDRQHWAFVVDGEVELESGSRRWSIPSGSAFFVPGSLPHRIRSAGAARIAGFERLEPGRDVSDERLEADGYEFVRGRPGAQPRAVVPRVGPGQLAAEPGEVATEGVPMGDLVMCQTRFGSRSGFASPFCDVEHWGLVTAGSMAIEWEDDIEVLTAGDVFFCPPGPPGHRFTAADPAASIDFTPLAAFDGAARLVDWRRNVTAAVRSRRRQRGAAAVEIAALR